MRHALEHLSSIATQVAGFRQQYNDHFPARLDQLARRNETVAPVVTLSAHDPNSLRLRILREHELGHRGSGIFHQRERMHAETLAGGAIDLAHLGRAHDFHVRDAAISSTWRSCAGWPIAMRKSPASMRSSGAGLNRMP